MTSWTELVTTALLGTDRRPITSPGVDGGTDERGAEPTRTLLDLAARHRARARAGHPLTRCPAPPMAPVDDRPWAPGAAQELLGRLLLRPVPELVNAWLAAAAGRGVRPAPEHWTALASVAATRPEHDRGLLRQALGIQALWFVDQNPAWRRLAEAFRGVGPIPTPEPSAAEPARPVPGEAEVRARPEAALAVPAPWPRALTLAALRVVIGGQLGHRAARYGAAVGARVAEDDHHLLQQALDALAEVSDQTVYHRTGPGLPFVREALQAALAAAETRTEIDRVFDRSDPKEGP